MKRNLKYVIAIVAAFPMLMYTSCTEDKPMEEEVEVEIVTEEKPQNEKFYQIPAPDEMFGFIKKSGLTYNKALINSPQKQSNYTTPLGQTMIFGVYSADLAYTAAYEEFNESIKYFATIQKLAENIGISGAFNEELMNNIKNNLDKPEELLENSNDSYFSVVDYLEQNDQGDKLGIIAAAGWLETVYIVANSIDYNKNDAALQRLADQKLTLDNLLMYLDRYNDKADVKEMITMLKELEVVFEPVAEKDANSSGITLKKKGEGKMVLGGGSSLKITKEQFEAIKSKVTELRTKIVK
ncbi:MAG: hypothetical protein OQJ96_07945 [Flavobacteriales bacterium]|nr:hypothetical protein [Flavobacteriales bacterium]MCW8912267.1 hypothetical protein [Flavobacteriales bacterium]MCW8937494.1 hypothetical protein [Flavobacteriales bacterium]MCW8940779.1 hypothetical protein [Flavobacteriales bacterium]MCW8967181.1 hypothetical protein [Flavobacteriales bacterium]